MPTEEIENIKTEEEFMLEKEKILLENEDEKEDAQRKMTWTSLITLIIFPLLIVIVGFIDPIISKQLTEIAGPFFLSVAGIIMAFFGAEAYMKKGIK